MLKKIAVIILTLGLLVASPFLSGAAGSENFMQTSKNNESIRIIVELDDAPVIEKATQQGLPFKQMSVKQADTMRASLNAQHISVKDMIKAKQISIKYHNDFVNVMNGFSATASASDLEKIQNLPGVKRVSIAQKFEIPAPQPNMVTSKGIVKAHPTWDLGYKGQGKVVAIIDTCLDYTHKDMRLSDGVEGKLSQEKVEQIEAAENLPGHWFSAKVPYGYNYADNNDNILSEEPHGMHVAGIVGANCADESETDGIKGVAPEVQLLAMKVFSDDPEVTSIWEDVFIRAMEDSVVLGADVMNLSFGSEAGFVCPDPTYDTIQRVTANGVVVAVAAGNANCFGDAYQFPYAKNPDIGVVASPGNLPGTLQVASIDNSTMIKVIECGDQKIPYQNSNDTLDPVTVFNGQMEYLDCGLGLSNEDFTGLDLTGKIALIKRGGGTFETKILNAQDHGAAGVIIYNHESGGEDLVTMGLSDDDSIKIPAVFIGNHGGEVLKSLISTQIEFNGDEVPTAVKMSPFSSWGTTPNLDFKPDITAPGGNIYSTIANNQYEVLSGTSMATPYVAGGTALVLQRMETDAAFSGLSGIERVTMAGNLLMSTARPQEVSEGVEVSPRRQGAGLMDLYAATTSMAIVRDPKTGLSKVNLQEIGDTKEFAVSVSNFGEVDLRFQVSGTVLTSSPYISDGVSYINTNDEQVVLDADKQTMPISFSETEDGVISVPAGETVNFTVNLDLSDPVCSLKDQDSATTSQENLNDIFPNGTFIEGFIRLTDVNEKVPQLSIPYLGFYGKWDQAPIFDASLYNNDAEPFYGVYQGEKLLGSYMQSGSMILGHTNDSMNPDLIAISPNGDGEQDDAQAVLELLRNAREMKVEILNDESQKLRDLGSDEYFTKDYNLNESPLTAPVWDGKINGVASDGDYIYRVEARIDWEDSAWQTIDFPVRVDTVPPVIDSLVLNDGKITAHASDGAFPVVNYMLYDEIRGVLASSADGEFDLSDLAVIPYQLKVMAKDAAGNTTLSELLITGTDNTKPVVYLEAPKVRGFYNAHDVAVNGYVEEDNQLVSLLVDGNDVDCTYNAHKDHYEFSTTVTLEDGSHNLTIKATDSAGNSGEFVRKIFIDTIPPVINVAAEPSAVVSSATETIRLAAIIDENMGGLSVCLNDSQIYYKKADISLDSDVLLPVHYEMPAQTITLASKDNLISLRAVDMAGNETVREFHVQRLQPGEETGSGGGGGGGSGGSGAGTTSAGISRTVKPDQQQTISTNGAQVYIPEEAVGEQVKISVHVLPSTEDLTQPDRLISAVYEFSKDITGNFLKPVKITLPFDLTELDRDKDIPVLCWLNESSQQWVEIENCEVDWDKGEIAGSVDHFTKFAVLMSAAEQTKELTDIAGHWAQDNINKLVQEKIINGYDDGSFHPDQSISRAEFCTMLVKYLALDTADAKDIGADQTTSFADIKTHWAKSYIETAFKAGIVEGYDANKFGPDDPITREQMTAMIGKAIRIEASGDMMAFSDTDKISAWAAPFVTAAVHDKLISGYPDSSFKPQGNATRAEAVTVIVKLQRENKK